MRRLFGVVLAVGLAVAASADGTVTPSQACGNGTVVSSQAGSCVADSSSSGAATVDILHKSTAAVATSGTAEEVLHTYTLPAGSLAAIGDKVELLGTCTHAANANAKSWRLEWGGISGTAVTAISSTSSGIKTSATASCTRTSATTATCIPVTGSNAAAGAVAALVQLTSQDFTASIVLVLTATTAVAAGDLSCEAFVVTTTK
jgi:hypothetical protein